MFLTALLIIIALGFIVMCLRQDNIYKDEHNYGIMKQDIEERLKQKQANN